MVRSRLARAFVLSLAVFALALRASGDEPKTYRWVGEDGHVYTTTTPPPNGKGLIDDAAPAPAPVRPHAPPAPAPAPAAAHAAPAASAFPPYIKPRSDAKAVPAAPAPDTEACQPYQDWVHSWRQARANAQAADARLDKVQDDDEHFYLSPNDSGHLDRVEGAQRAADAAHERESSIETEAHRAGVPQSCFSD